MERRGVELTAEPVSGSFVAPATVAEAVTVRVFVDESVRTMEDVETLLSRMPAGAGVVSKSAKFRGPWAVGRG